MSQNFESSTSNSSLETTNEPGSPGEMYIVFGCQLLQENFLEIRRRRVIERNREAGNSRLVDDYFSENEVYPDYMFRRQFRMRKELLNRIVEAIQSRSPFFQQRADAAGRQSLSPLQKCTTAIRQLAYGVSIDHLDEYLRMSETSAMNCLFKFCQIVVKLFGERYLRRPNQDDIQRLLKLHEERHDFPGMLCSLHCMHWEWKNFPMAWKWQFTRGHGSPTVVLEAIVSQDLRIWHAFFGVAGSRNDINVLNKSPLFNEVLGGTAPNIHFTVTQTTYSNGYYLTDGIYQEWCTFVKAFLVRKIPKENYLK